MTVGASSLSACVSQGCLSIPLTLRAAHESGRNGFATYDLLQKRSPLQMIKNDEQCSAA